MKSNIPLPDVDTIVVDVNKDMCNIFTENSNVEEMSTEPMPDSEDTSTAANHSFPANTSCNSETMWKGKSRKSQALSQLQALKERKIEQLEKAVQQKLIIATTTLVSPIFLLHIYEKSLVSNESIHLIHCKGSLKTIGLFVSKILSIYRVK